ncbi:MAG: minichromosome maintenance protein MCM [Candidatus Aenigmarchaeota archaeon]|nr:minichromosome maintenance protein MCM [Candidatus Aenigmarchaeota archaeon]
MDVLHLEQFLHEKYLAELHKALNEDKAVVIDFSVFDRFDPVTADQLLEDPENVLKAFREAAESIVQEKIHVRFRNLPESRHIRIRNLRARHMNRLWTVDATIKSASEVKPQIYEAVFECPECAKKIPVVQETNILQKPGQCECGRRGDFSLVEKKLYDVRWLQGIEPFEITTGEQPGEISILLKEDLTTPRMQKKTDPGSRLTIVGVLKELPKRIKGKLSTKMDMYIEATYAEPSEIEFEELEITEEDEKKILELSKDTNVYEKLKASIAPGLWGFDEIKEAVLLQLFGGIAHHLADGSRIRGNIHILLTGDPGVGKTQILKLVSSVVPRGRYVSGSGVSGAGLTATVVKNEIIGGWVLEAGALILCNKGLIAIDEFDKMSRDDQIAMHEATSIETVSIAKASIVATLPAQTAVLAGANPQYGRFDPFKSVAEQIQIPETLLSRFDLKFALKDKPDKAADAKLADHIISTRRYPQIAEPIINRNLLRKYIAYAKQIQDMELTEEAAAALKDFYVDMRNRNVTQETNTVSITLRQYEALIRLAEASAKIRLDTKVRIEDADRAIRLMKYSLTQLGYDYETGAIDIDRIEGGMPASKRKKISIVMEIIDTLHKESKEIALEDIRAEAENRGIEGVDEVVARLLRDGAIFEPRAGFIRKV